MITLKPLPGPLTMRDPAALVATGLGSGRLHPMPGTWGTLAALPLGVALLVLQPALLLVAALVAFALGLWAVRQFEAASGTHDAGMIVIDEWVGFWITLFFAEAQWHSVLVAFVAFRAFDMLKPWPIRWLDKNLHGAWGVIVDDVAAGIAAGVCVYGYGIWIASF